jgi:hypothetical protein
MSHQILHLSLRHQILTRFRQSCLVQVDRLSVPMN